MTPDALDDLREPGPTYEVVRSRHLVWRWWVFLSCFGETIDSAECITKRRAERIGREWVERMKAVARSGRQR